MGPLRNKSRPAEAICAGCDLLPTKPGSMPAHLAQLAAQTFRMEALFEGGAGAEYPNFFTPLEWEAFLALKYARAKDQEKSFPKPKGQARGSAQAALEERLQRK
jgi:hypothetical protein